jgi:hypothetical protein
MGFVCSVVCAEKIVMVNGIVGFGGLILLALLILSALVSLYIARVLVHYYLL